MNHSLDVATKLIVATEFWSAVIGALVGGLIAYFVQRSSSKEARKQRAEDKLERQQSLATSLIFKLMRMYSDLNSLNNHIERPWSLPHNRGAAPWQVIRPLANLPDIVNFTADELTVLVSHTTGTVADLAMDLDVRHNSIVATMQSYNASRTLLADRLTSLSGNTSVAEGVASFVTEGPAFQALLPMMADADSIIHGLRTMLPEATSDARKALSEAHEQLQRKLKLAFKIALPHPPPLQQSV